MTRRDYLRLWDKRHPGYKAADSRRRALFRPANRAFYREILGVQVRVNLIPLAVVEKGQKCWNQWAPPNGLWLAKSKEGGK